MRRTAITTIVTLISFPFLVKSFNKIQLNAPYIIPLAIEYVVTINRIVKNAGTASVVSSKSMSLTGEIMNNPTKIRAGEVAAAGIEINRGAKKRERRNNTATVKLVNPVLPPSLTPAEDSTYVVTVEVPSIAPNVVPIASANNASLHFGIEPSAFRMSALVAHPINVPTVSNISTKRKVNTMITMSIVKTEEKSNCKNVGANEGGRYEPPPYEVTPNGIPTTVVKIIPIKRAPLTL